MTHHHSTSRPYPILPHLFDTPVSLRLQASDAQSDTLLRNVHLLRDSIALAQRQWDFDIWAAVVLPSELQMMAVFQAGEFGIRQAMAMVQRTFDRHVSGEWAGWDGPADLVSVDPAAARVRKAFIEAAPVRRGLVARPGDWPYSSAQSTAVQATQLGTAVA